MLDPDMLRFVADNYLKWFSTTKWSDMLPYVRHSLARAFTATTARYDSTVYSTLEPPPIDRAKVYSHN